jgi:hypothetical protein
MAGWLTAIAVAALLQAIGKFLDDYHINPKTKDRLRLALVRAFVTLDDVPIPDVPRRTMISFLRVDTRLGIRHVAVVVVASVLATSAMFWILEGAIIIPTDWQSLRELILPTTMLRGDAAWPPEAELYGILGDEGSGGAVCRHFNDLDSVLEFDTSDDFRQLICSVQPPPSF